MRPHAAENICQVGVCDTGQQRACKIHQAAVQHGKRNTAEQQAGRGTHTTLMHGHQRTAQIQFLHHSGQRHNHQQPRNKSQPALRRIQRSGRKIRARYAGQLVNQQVEEQRQHRHRNADLNRQPDRALGQPFQLKPPPKRLLIPEREHHQRKRQHKRHQLRQCEQRRAAAEAPREFSKPCQQAEAQKKRKTRQQRDFIVLHPYTAPAFP